MEMERTGEGVATVYRSFNKVQRERKGGRRGKMVLVAEGASERNHHGADCSASQND